MLEDYKKDIELLMIWYERTKDVTIMAESLDTVNSGFIQPLHEQRYCLDHFIRAIVYERDGLPEEKVKKAISSAIGHLQRGYSDSIEWMLVSVVDDFSTVLKPFTSEQISKGFPNYYSEIRPEIDKIKNLVNEYKINKSVEKASDTQEEATLIKITEQFVDEDVVTKLKQYLEALHKHQSTLIDIMDRDKREEKKATIKDKIVFPIITGVIGAVIGALIMLAF